MMLPPYHPPNRTGVSSQSVIHLSKNLSIPKLLLLMPLNSIDITNARVAFVISPLQ